MPELDSQNHILGYNFLIFLFPILIRWCVALHSYSGENTPPMYGDYEAQRHWMEITYNIPMQDWYKNTGDNNLTYWGLDYPPLTAYHSLVYGLISSHLLPESIHLHTSKGFENYLHKLFMRYSVLVVDLLIYIPAIYWYCKSRKKGFSANVNVFLALLYPGIILIDYGHFQYNCVSLGFFVAAVAALSVRSYKMGAFLFCLAVNYKQMELYHSLPFFFFFLGQFFSKCRRHSITSGVKFLLPIGCIVIFTFIALWYPVSPTLLDLKQVLHRVFPVYRGLYEDKVSSFWCVFNIFYKLHQINNDLMLKICLLVTLAFILPSVINLFFYPTVERFILSLIICSMCFFLFSYHVHEKSILLVAIPVILDFDKRPFSAFWFLFISTFSMLPLLIKDGLFLPFLALFLLYCICFVTTFRRQVTQLKVSSITFVKFESFVIFSSFLGCILLAILSRFYPPPSRYPYLWPLLVSCYSFVHFAGFLLYYYYLQCGMLLK